MGSIPTRQPQYLVQFGFVEGYYRCSRTVEDHFYSSLSSAESLDYEAAPRLMIQPLEEELAAQNAQGGADYGEDSLDREVEWYDGTKEGVRLGRVHAVSTPGCRDKYVGEGYFVALFLTEEEGQRFRSASYEERLEMLGLPPDHCLLQEEEEGEYNDD